MHCRRNTHLSLATNVNTGYNSLLFGRSPLEYLADHQRVAFVINLLKTRKS